MAKPITEFAFIDPTAFRISHLCDMLEEYLEPDQISEIYRAYLFGAEAHDGQHRKSGEPYIYHPVAVARILCEMHMDHKSIVAALLHDVIEDTPTAIDQLTELFGEEVAGLVDGVSKLTHIEFATKQEAQAENFRKMMLAMTRDLRVIIVKLADRLHNMRTLGVMRSEKQRRIARETLDIYAPIANRLGMNKLRIELEDLGFRAYYPMRARVLEHYMKKARGNRKEIVEKIGDTMRERMRHEKIDAEIVGREKHLYSIYKKMQEKELPFTEIMDVYAFRISVDTVDMCYRALGVVHNLYKPVPGRFKDYIAIPKANGYQSLHTVLFSPYSVPIEVQIRSNDMDRVAEAGIAAHWLYKTGEESASNNAQIKARQWVHHLLEMQQNSGDSVEFLESVKVDLFPDEVYVFTPQGEIKALPRGATAVDFAYAVHTDVGNRCVAVKIDRRIMAMRTELRNGQTVEIITAKGARPNPSWLNFIYTARARSCIRHYLKNLQQDEAISLGKRLLNKSLEEHEISLDEIPKKLMKQTLKEFKFKRVDQLFEEIGLGNRMPMIITRFLVQQESETKKGSFFTRRSKKKPLLIQGTEGSVISFAKCCRPIPGDDIVGFASAGRGIVVHMASCNNFVDSRNEEDKWIDVEWEKTIDRDFSVELRMLVVNQRGTLAKIAAIISDFGSNIENVQMNERDGQNSSLTFSILVRDRQNLAGIIRHLRAQKVALLIQRVQK